MTQGDQTPSRALDKARTPAAVLPMALKKPHLLTSSNQKITGSHQHSAEASYSFIIELLIENPLEAVLHQLWSVRMVSHC